MRRAFARSGARVEDRCGRSALGFVVAVGGYADIVKVEEWTRRGGSNLVVLLDRDTVEALVTARDHGETLKQSHTRPSPPASTDARTLVRGCGAPFSPTPVRHANPRRHGAPMTDTLSVTQLFPDLAEPARSQALYQVWVTVRRVEGVATTLDPDHVTVATPHWRTHRPPLSTNYFQLALAPLVRVR